MEDDTVQPSERFALVRKPSWCISFKKQPMGYGIQIFCLWSIPDRVISHWWVEKTYGYAIHLRH
jgi:hypothetical protein